MMPMLLLILPAVMLLTHERSGPESSYNKIINLDVPRDAVPESKHKEKRGIAVDGVPP